LNERLLISIHASFSGDSTYAARLLIVHVDCSLLYAGYDFYQEHTFFVIGLRRELLYTALRTGRCCSYQ